ncbi:guanine deaminase, putative [Babesia caballi]|uniref:Guanine deaminase, putative n=1 Tax=Babesia caballi TaxID=5871 RepID=A0AAV4M152_BABCB|nr:guanine deaminase, putative [Babesia caballi]
MEVERVSSESEGSSTTEEMARLLLAGWTMLSETCSVCRDVPLMRSREGVLKCCRCGKESRPAASGPVGDCTSTIGPGKYRIVEEGSLDSSLVTGIHGEAGERPLYKGPVVSSPTASPTCASHVPQRAPASLDGRRLQQLCLLRVELSKALDRYTMLLHAGNERMESDVAGYVGLCVLAHYVQRGDGVGARGAHGAPAGHGGLADITTAAAAAARLPEAPTQPRPFGLRCAAAHRTRTRSPPHSSPIAQISS